MSEINDRCLDAFPGWLRTLDEDVHAALNAIESGKLPEGARKFLLGGINYLFKSLDLIPDGIDDIGYLDDAFVLRLSAKYAFEEDFGDLEPETVARLGKLSNETDLIQEFLGQEVFDRLEKYTRDLRRGAARGRSVDELMEQSDLFKEFSAEVMSFTKEYSSPGFAKDEKNLIKLKAFFDAKLPK